VATGAQNLGFPVHFERRPYSATRAKRLAYQPVVAAPGAAAATTASSSTEAVAYSEDESVILALVVQLLKSATSSYM